MNKIIYHGSQNEVNQPQYGVGKKHNDYGLGFYCTEIIELAKEWACFTREDGYVNKSSLDMSGVKVLDLNSKDYHILNWLSVLLENRNFQIKSELSVNAYHYIQQHFSIEYDDYDVIIGYRADDSYFSFAEDFLQGTISLQLLSQAMKLGQLGEQVVLKSPKAFQRLTFVDSIEVPYLQYFSKRLKRDQQARKEYVKSRQGNKFHKDDIYILDIIREEIDNHDKRLR